MEKIILPFDILSIILPHAAYDVSHYFGIQHTEYNASCHSCKKKLRSPRKNPDCHCRLDLVCKEWFTIIHDQIRMTIEKTLVIPHPIMLKHTKNMYFCSDACAGKTKNFCLTERSKKAMLIPVKKK